jgi:hypothetical protein
MWLRGWEANVRIGPLDRITRHLSNNSAAGFKKLAIDHSNEIAQALWYSGPGQA